MALIGCLSLFAFWRLLLVMTDRKTALAGLALLAICPWHILKSRWALESNLFPDLLFVRGAVPGDRPAARPGCRPFWPAAAFWPVVLCLWDGVSLPAGFRAAAPAFPGCQEEVVFPAGMRRAGVLAVVALPMMLFVLVQHLRPPGDPSAVYDHSTAPGQPDDGHGFGFQPLNFCGTVSEFRGSL